MHTTEDSFPVPVTATVRPSIPFDIPYALAVIRRNWLLPIICCLVGVTAALIYIALTPSLYSSSSRILLDRSVNRYLQSKKIIDEPVLEETDAASQVHIISSESIIVPVVRAMNLSHDPEFVGPNARNIGGSSWGLNSLIDLLKGFGSADPTTQSETRLERVAVEAFLKRLTVYRDDVPSVITITFASEDASKAANIANAIAERYLATNDEFKLKSTRLAAELLQERLTDLKQQASEADRMLTSFMNANRLTANKKIAESPDVVTGLTGRLSMARATIAEAKARLEMLKDPRNESTALAAVSDNTVILGLRSQYLELSIKQAELEKRVGKDHAAVSKIRNRAAELESAIQDERRRIAGGYKSEYELALARQGEISSELARMVAGAGGADSQARVTMRELESSAETLRKSYDSVLQRLNELSVSNGVVGPDARIITRAAAPLRKSPRRAGLALGAGAIFGCLMGLGLALGREFVSGVVRTPNQLRDITGAYCAVLPRASPEPGLSAQAQSTRLMETVLDAPFSRIADAFRHMSAVLITRQEPDRGSVVCVVSSVPNEGKTAVTANLGALMASGSKWRVLVIDCDLHRGSLTHSLAPDATEGLIEALADPTRLPSLVLKRERSRLDVLPCVTEHRPPDAAELLGSAQMARIFEMARKSYDFIIIEVPPVMSVADVKMLEHHVDQFVLVAEWGVTKKRLISEALFEVDGLRERLSCVVLNKADPAFLRRIEAFKGPKIAHYYEG